MDETFYLHLKSQQTKRLLRKFVYPNIQQNNLTMWVSYQEIRYVYTIDVIYSFNIGLTQLVIWAIPGAQTVCPSPTYLTSFIYQISHHLLAREKSYGMHSIANTNVNTFYVTKWVINLIFLYICADRRFALELIPAGIDVSIT